MHLLQQLPLEPTDSTTAVPLEPTDSTTAVPLEPIHSETAMPPGPIHSITLEPISSGPAIPPEPINSITAIPPVSNNSVPSIRRSTRVSYPSTKLKDYICNVVTSQSMTVSSPTGTGMSYPIQAHLSFFHNNSYKSLLTKLCTESEPTTFSQARKHLQWQKTMDDEMNALLENKTWSIESLPVGKQAIGCKWIYKIKRHADGTIERYKARLVAKGYTQMEGFDYHETFAPVAKLTTVRCFIALATYKR
ncbi:hypothetical protein NE237_001710 [Protea cynaroides]|uniref:Reverse transcriptase Ty1/copia-type domain-containing protein n=1 Tax=Protea cynaroides TaxID=273540 RepID=A0A9Q0QYQ1_9MAGN|nr:hypothetical protein NE237_001710 [Protea cynaroides]